MRRALVVDADAETRALYHTALTLAGWDVAEALDGRDAMAMALADPPTLIITESRLAGLDAHALCDILRRDAATRSVAILVVTADARKSQWARIRTAGADAVLIKPAPPDIVMGEVQRLLMRPATAHGAEAPTDAPARPRTSGQTRSDERRTALVKSHARGRTITPPAPPPLLRCPSCDQPMAYEHSQVGGVSERYPEQWDYYDCPTCGPHQYRQRTRKVRRIS